MKGRRRQFDVDSEPTGRERSRLADDADEAADQWIDEGPVRDAAHTAVRRGSNRPAPSTDARQSSGRNAKRSRQRASKRMEGALEIDRNRLVRQLGQARADRTLERLAAATEAFAEDRVEETRVTLKPLVELVPQEPALRELYGLSLYRLGRWKAAVAELDEFHRLTGSVEQHPVLADCHRALRNHERVAELWDDLGAASPEAAIVAEGRIVYAGSLADQGHLPAAIKVLEAAPLGSKKLREHHLRLRYALGDLYDRAGEQQAARRQFAAVAAAAPDFVDVRDRLDQL